MYDELKKSLRECCGTNSYICNCENCIMKDKRKDGDYTECVDALGLAAADAIEELNKVVKHQAEILHRYGGETGIRQTSETVEVLYKQLAEYRKYDSFLALHGFNFEPPAAEGSE